MTAGERRSTFLRARRRGLVVAFAGLLAGAPALASPEGGATPRADGPCLAFPAGEDAAFLLEAGGGPPRARVLDVDGREAAPPAVETTPAGALRLVARGLLPGHYRLVMDTGAEADAARRATPFAVLPPGIPREPAAGTAIAADAALSWLVARPGAPLDGVREAIQLARRAGIRLLRDRIAWEEVEPRPGEYRWGRYDAVATACREAGIDVYQIFHASPSWSRADRDSKRMPDDLRAAYRFARAAAERFRGRVVAWEPWNEPDIPVFSTDPADQVAAFQKAAYLGFKAGDPGAAVLMVSLAHPPGPFVEGFLENETGPFLDAYNYHTYEGLDGLPHYIENGVQFGLLERDRAPGPGYAALAALAAALGEAKAPRRLEALPAGAAGWLFSRGDGREAAALWAREEAPVTLPAGLEARDMYGRSLGAGPGGALVLGSKVTYAVGRPDAFAAWRPGEAPRPGSIAPAPFSLAPVVLRFVFPADCAEKPKEAWRVPADGALAGQLQVYNFSGEPFRGNLRIEPEPGLAAEPAEAAVRVGPHGLETVEVRLRWEAAGPPVRRARAFALAEGGQGSRSSAALVRIVGP
ncbi:MAG: hypothetical protein HY721_24305 [Planctomycetes bacterium]|nr:hypothetical protein [Planctomycetota bacterium]